MTTKYTVRLDREACDGVFACLVRDDRFIEADDGVAALAVGDTDGPTAVATFEDDSLAAAEGAAAACPLDAIEVEAEVSDGE